MCLVFISIIPSKSFSTQLFFGFLQGPFQDSLRFLKNTKSEEDILSSMGVKNIEKDKQYFLKTKTHRKYQMKNKSYEEVSSKKFQKNVLFFINFINVLEPSTCHVNLKFRE